MRAAFLSFLALFGAACNPSPGGSHSHEHGAGAGHEHEARTAQITVWSDRYEVFAEHPAPVAGQPVRFITHVTNLETGKPRLEGMVKFVLRQGDAVFEHPQAAPDRPGIYLPAITFPKVGTWRAELVVPGQNAIARVDLGEIIVYADDHAAAHAEIPDAPEGISFLKEQQWKILTRIEPVERRRLVERLKLPAVTEAKPGASAPVSAPVSGQLTVPEGGQFPGPGDRVVQGQLLALLRPAFSEAAARFIASEGEFARAAIELEQAKQTYERLSSLAAQGARSEREAQEAKLALESARAAHAAAESLRSTYRQIPQAASNGPAAPPRSFAALELRAPIAGTINQIHAGLGEPVSAGTALFQIINPEILWIKGQIPETALARIPPEAGATLALPGGSEWIPLGEAGGRQIFTGLQVDPATRTVPIIYEIKNPGLRIGQAVTLHVATDHAEDAIAIPESALVEEGGTFVAFVQVSGETFDKRDLLLGLRDGHFIQVLAGLREGERVVTRGAMAIRLASVSGVIPAHGHAH